MFFEDSSNVNKSFSLDKLMVAFSRNNLYF